MTKKISLALLFLLVLLFAGYKLWVGEEGLKEEILTIDNKDKLKKEGMVFIAGNSFIMGSGEDKMARENEIPAHKVDVIGYFIDKYEVTNAQFKKFLEDTGRKSVLVDPVNRNALYNWKDGSYPFGKGANPVALVSWDDAKAFCEWAGKRLPSEAEWEMACRGNEPLKWSFGNNFVVGRANTNELRLNGSRKVGSFSEDISPYGLFDMAGNVMEWTDSWYLPYPGSELRDISFGKKKKVIRGGGWVTDLRSARCANRTVAPSAKRHRALGFRCAQEIRGGSK